MFKRKNLMSILLKKVKLCLKTLNFRQKLSKAPKTILFCKLKLLLKRKILSRKLIIKTYILKMYAFRQSVSVNCGASQPY